MQGSKFIEDKCGDIDIEKCAEDRMYTQLRMREIRENNNEFLI